MEKNQRNLYVKLLKLRSNKFILFENVKIISGHKFSAIIDLQRTDIFHLPNAINLFVESCLGKTVIQILKEYSSQRQLAKQYLRFLLDNELCAFVPDPSLFPNMSDNWDNPHSITNCIIDINNEQNLDELVKSINGFKIPFYNFRVFKINELIYIQKLMILAENQSLTGFSIYLPYVESHINPIVDQILNSDKCFSAIFYNAPENQRIVTSDLNKDVFLSSNSFSSHLDCGKIEGFFNPSLETYTESINYNSCLNRKVSIDIDGNIKNCPSMVDSYGNINSTTIEEAIAKPNFKQYWTLNKNLIHVCRDCEFRFICTDCRAFVEDPKDILSKPLKCGYNPYIGEWSDWLNNPLKMEAIRFYEMENLKV